MSKSRGYILLYRDIQNNSIWESEPFDRSHAWIDLLLMANYEDKTFILGNEVVQARAGEVITSELKLMNRWKWGKEKLRNYLKMLEQMDMIERKPDSRKTVIFIKNYSEYQTTLKHTDSNDGEEQQTNRRPQLVREIAKNQTDYQTTTEPTESMFDGESQTDYQTDNRPIADRRPTTNNTLYEYTNNALRERGTHAQPTFKLYGEFENVQLTDAQYAELLSRYPDDIANGIEKFSEHKASTGKQYESDYARLLSWLRDDKKKRLESGSKTKNDYMKHDISNSQMDELERKKLAWQIQG
jgi:hypothetical protein